MRLLALVRHVAELLERLAERAMDGLPVDPDEIFLQACLAELPAGNLDLAPVALHDVVCPPLFREEKLRRALGEKVPVFRAKPTHVGSGCRASVVCHPFAYPAAS